jgi:TrmH family RNA methyltransferase
MLSNNRKKELISLKQKKYRQRYGQFMVEGEKSVFELYNSDYDISEILLTKEQNEKFGHLLNHPKTLVISSKEMDQLSALETAPGIIAVSNFKEIFIDDLHFENKISLFLDGISDPGNLGTIIRIADWYGINQIVCSPNCVDLYNPKTIASSMGSFSRINVLYHPLTDVLKNCKVPSFACVMNGESIQDIKPSKEAIIIIGNEANGISEEVENLSSRKVTIPRVGKAESLNAGIAAAIICHKFILG